MPNKEKQNRFWLVYSPSTGKVFCAVCLLFKEKNSFTTGFNDLKNNSSAETHENSKEQKSAMSSWRSFNNPGLNFNFFLIFK